MRTALKNISLLIALVAVVYIVANYSGFAKNQVFSLLHMQTSEVKGASTQKAEEVSNKLKSDVTEQFEIVKEQALSFSVEDAINAFSRLQKVPEDFESIKSYTQEQIDRVIQSRKQK